jgi:hypothetical protein
MISPLGKDVLESGEVVEADKNRPLMMNTVWCLQETGAFNGGTRVAGTTSRGPRGFKCT